MLTVHHLGISQSERIVWLCEELEIPYKLIRYDRDPVTRGAPPEYKALHFLGMAPVITDGDVVLPESGAIMEYIIARHGGGRLALDASDPDFPHYLFWLHYTNATFLPAGLVGMLSNAGLGPHPIVEAFEKRAKLGNELLEKRLGEADYLAGEKFSAADIMMFYPLTTMRAFLPRDLEPFPNIRAYLKRVGARPAYLRAKEKGDPGAPLKLE